MVYFYIIPWGSDVLKKNFVQKGERDFISGCLKAIEKCKTDKIHALYELKNGVRKYIVHDHPEDQMNYEGGEPVKCICSVGYGFISDIHQKAGQDELSKPWIRFG